MIRVFIVESMGLARRGLEAVLDEEPDITVVAAVGTDADIVGTAVTTRPDVALVDLDVRVGDGFAVAQELRRALPTCATVFTAGRPRPGDLRKAVAAEAAGFVAKDRALSALADAIRRVSRGERVIDDELAFAALGMNRSPLTPRELEVLRLAAEGATPDEIAAALVLSVGTIRNHLSRINSKIGARNRVHAIRIAEESGWL